MLLRWLSALAGIPLFLGLCLWGVVPWTIAVLIVSAIGLKEILTVYWAHGIRANPLLAALGLLGPAGVLITVLINLPTAQSSLLRAVIVGLFIALVGEVVQAARTGQMRVTQNVSYGLLCGMYIALFGGLALLRAGTEPVNGGLFPRLEVGAARILLATFCVWATDSLALFVGRAVGKRKLAPLLSPNKTVEGALGGLSGALLTGALLGQILLGVPLHGLLVGAIAGVFGQLGDLFKSALKREVGIKDFGSIIPGHGGVLDRFDSLLFVAPLVSLVLNWMGG